MKKRYSRPEVIKMLKKHIFENFETQAAFCAHYQCTPQHLSRIMNTDAVVPNWILNIFSLKKAETTYERDL